MRVVVVGGSGNVGTAVIERLRQAPEVTEIVGVSRRPPNTGGGPYAGLRWHAVDVGAPEAVERLTPAFAGADAVILLAWLLQPNRDEATMWRTNVTGTRHVLDAAAAAGVTQVACASSVGAYSAAPKSIRVDETWPTGGVHTSHYAREKAAMERVLDAFEVRHPGVILTRLRPGLVMQAPAAEHPPAVPRPLVPHRLDHPGTGAHRAPAQHHDRAGGARLGPRRRLLALPRAAGGRGVQHRGGAGGHP